MKRIWIIVLMSIIFKTNYAQNESISISIPETYELSNIILAITPYTLDENSFEVAKGTQYYNNVLTHFMNYSNHPLIQKVNYSLEKWDYYLSFRTDAYGFIIDENEKLVRIIDFRTQSDRNEFENNLALVEDFIKISGFREFYKNHQPYYDSILNLYSKNEMILEMIAFLKKEFPLIPNQIQNTFAIVVSPLVNRMNCHRIINNIPTDFISLPNYVLYPNKSGNISKKALASGIHMLFTETSHGFINPTTDDFEKIVKQKFDSSKWDKNSGYDEYEFGVFNEYMTWAVYDLFIYKYFPEIAEEVCEKWAKQNEARGFIASRHFNKKLLELYQNKNDDETIRDLYPKLLNWCSDFQKDLSN
jgi:hypothetical protein